MTPFKLKIVTPAGLIYDGEAEKLIVRTTEGDHCILARHINYMAALGMGMATVVADGQTRHAACIGGMLSMLEGEATLVASTFEWAEDIDIARAKDSARQAEAILAERDRRTEHEVAQPLQFCLQSLKHSPLCKIPWQHQDPAEL